MPQNLRPGSFSVPQLVHLTRATGSYYRERKYRSPLSCAGAEPPRYLPDVLVVRMGRGMRALALLLAASRYWLGAVEDLVDRAACLEGGAEGGLRARGVRIGLDVPASLAGDVQDFIAAVLLGWLGCVIRQPDRCFAGGLRVAGCAAGVEKSMRTSPA